MTSIVLTGGGSAGHVTPHLALLPKLIEAGWEVSYVGTGDGIERSLIEGMVPYYPISAGKLRRYADIKNLVDPFRVLKGLVQSYRLLRRLRPTMVFSKGGFVTVPVVVAARMLKIPVVIHESDFTPGLANRLAQPFASHVCVTFPETKEHIKRPATVTGTPIRKEILTGERAVGMRILGFSSGKPIVLIMGGSLGAKAINKAVRTGLPSLLDRFQIVHLCGKGNLIPELESPGYKQFEYVNEELGHFLAASDVVVSRAGANAIFELLALHKPNLLIPLSKAASRGDQILNAQSFAKQGFSVVLPEESLSPKTLEEQLLLTMGKKNLLSQAMQKSALSNGTNAVWRVLQNFK